MHYAAPDVGFGVNDADIGDWIANPTSRYIVVALASGLKKIKTLMLKTKNKTTKKRNTSTPNMTLMFGYHLQMQ
jgi:hypothetical protein